MNHVKKLSLLLFLAAANTLMSLSPFSESSPIAPKPWVVHAIQKAVVNSANSLYEFTQTLEGSWVMGSFVSFVGLAGTLVAKMEVNNYLARKRAKARLERLQEASKRQREIDNAFELKSFEKEINDFCHKYPVLEETEVAILDSLERFKGSRSFSCDLAAFEAFSNEFCSFAYPYFSIAIQGDLLTASNNLRAIYEKFNDLFEGLRYKYLLEIICGHLTESSFDINQAAKDLRVLGLPTDSCEALSTAPAFWIVQNLIDLDLYLNKAVKQKFPKTFEQIEPLLVQSQKIVKILKETSEYKSEKSAFISSGKVNLA